MGMRQFRIRFRLANIGLSLMLAVQVILLASCSPRFVTVQETAPADVANYTIQVRLDPETHQITGTETITYRNTTQKPIPDLVFHLYLNAFKSTNTLFFREGGAEARGVLFEQKYNGWIEVSALRLVDGDALTLELLEDGTLAKAALPQAVKPGEQVSLEISFQAQFPKAIARNGWAKDEKGDLFFLGGQWFPKLGVWTETGWNAYPYHGKAEFFSDFGNYTVQLTVPGNYQTGATGVPNEPVKNSDGTQTVTYTAKGVIDFAWAASPNLREATRKVGDTEILFLYLPEHEWSVDRILSAAADAVQQFGEWYGPYPYPRLTIVDVPEDGAATGGMEYPSFITTLLFTRMDKATPKSPWLDYASYITIHETGHQWFQSVIATNEAEEPWLDEGFTEYSSMRLMIARYGLDEKSIDQGDFEPGILQDLHKGYLIIPRVPMAGKAWEYRDWNSYSSAVYAKPVFALMTLQREVGDETMNKILSTYARRYRFAHPTTKDFQKVATEVSKQPLTWFFGEEGTKSGLVYGDNMVNYVAKSYDSDSITVERFGEDIIPTEIQVNFADNTSETIAWDGEEKSHTIQFNKSAAVESFVIDPQHKLMIEYSWEDNQKP